MLQCPLDYDRGQLFSHNTVVFVINKTDHRNIVEKYRYITEHKTHDKCFYRTLKRSISLEKRQTFVLIFVLKSGNNKRNVSLFLNKTYLSPRKDVQFMFLVDMFFNIS